jgi:hypothetical protein
MKKCLEELATDRLARGDRRLQPVDHRHGFVDVGDDALLLDERGIAIGSRFNFAALIPFAVRPVAVFEVSLEKDGPEAAGLESSDLMLRTVESK